MPNTNPEKKIDFGAEKRDKPWKYETVYTVTVLEWAVENSNVSLTFYTLSHFTFHLILFSSEDTTDKYRRI